MLSAVSRVAERPESAAPRIGACAPRGALSVGEGEAHVWAVHLDRNASVVRSCATLLDQGERERAARFRRRIDRDRYIIAHAALRTILSRYVRQPAHALRFRRDRFGKPSLARGSRVSFNMAHSEAIALIAVGAHGTIGVDVERVVEIEDAFDVAEVCFAPAERRTLHAMPSSQVADAFFACWTRKEAFVKAIGTGLSAPLAAFEVSLAPGQPARLIRVSGSERVASAWTMQTLDPAPGYVGAIAIRRPGMRVTTWWLDTPGTGSHP